MPDSCTLSTEQTATKGYNSEHLVDKDRPHILDTLFKHEKLNEKN